jgi:hypothetical protein
VPEGSWEPRSATSGGAAVSTQPQAANEIGVLRRPTQLGGKSEGAKTSGTSRQRSTSSASPAENGESLSGSRFRRVRTAAGFR